MTDRQPNQHPSKAGRTKVGAGKKKVRRNRRMLLLIKRSAQLTENPAL
jgi:hypothetical protein